MLLPDVPMTFEAFVAHLGRTRDGTRLSQLEDFQREIRGGSG
ncbi:Hypothetical protein A7982_01003 [Minicystis rosea]|nr:Hypothetical protein A7982_01003 [Minicystis rosea]